MWFLIFNFIPWLSFKTLLIQILLEDYAQLHTFACYELIPNVVNTVQGFIK